MSPCLIWPYTFPLSEFLFFSFFFPLEWYMDQSGLCCTSHERENWPFLETSYFPQSVYFLEKVPYMCIRVGWDRGWVGLFWDPFLLGVFSSFNPSPPFSHSFGGRFRCLRIKYFDVWRTLTHPARHRSATAARNSKSGPHLRLSAF